MNAIDFLIGKVVLADLGAYQVSGKLLSCRDGRILINRSEARSIIELRRKA